jgi:hypothetical protein
MVSDVTRMGEWSPVCRACWWDEGDGPRAGAWFTGRNELPERTWETRSRVVAADRGREFAFAVRGSWVRWGYTFTPVAGGTQVTESWEFLPRLLNGPSWGGGQGSPATGILGKRRSTGSTDQGTRWRPRSSQANRRTCRPRRLPRGLTATGRRWMAGRSPPWRSPGRAARPARGTAERSAGRRGAGGWPAGKPARPGAAPPCPGG